MRKRSEKIKNTLKPAGCDLDVVVKEGKNGPPSQGDRPILSPTLSGKRFANLPAVVSTPLSVLAHQLLYGLRAGLISRIVGHDDFAAYLIAPFNSMEAL